MAEKKLINNEPKFGDLSQYNFPDGYTTNPPEVNDSLSLPKNNDKFQKKDLYTKAIGSELNEAIIERNLKVQYASSFIRIDKCYISEHAPLKAGNNRCEIWMFSQEDYPGVDFDTAGYSTIKNALKNETRIYRDDIPQLDGGNDWGQAAGLDGQNIIQDLNANSIEIQDFPNNHAGYNPINSFPLRDAAVNTKIIDENIYNPIYFIIRLRGDETQGHGTDVRDRAYQVYKINNEELFDYDDNGNAIPKITYYDDTNQIPRVNIVEGDGGGAGDEKPKWRVYLGDFHVSINTSGGYANDWEEDPDSIENSIDYIGPDEKLYEQYFSEVQPPIAFGKDYNNPTYLLNLSPKNQLNNNEKPGIFQQTYFFTDYFPITNINIIDKNGILQTNDLQSYYDDDNELILRQQTSAPATIGFNFDLVNPDTLIPNQASSFLYFVIDWDDKDDNIKTLDDWENIRPTDLFELFELQNQNLYKMQKQGYEDILRQWTLYGEGYEGNVIPNPYELFGDELGFEQGEDFGGLRHSSLRDDIEYGTYETANKACQLLGHAGYDWYSQADGGPGGTTTSEPTPNLVYWDGEQWLKEPNEYETGYYERLDCVDEILLGYTEEMVTHTYNTPGIKTIKSIVFTYNNRDDGFRYGRWKLVTSRFYLDIPINQYPDFAEVGGSDYTTIPWPYITPIIGGVDEDSKYKISVQDALSSGKIGDTDIIDERFLVNDLENDEMGKSINRMDLEQVRYFDKSYNINALLNIDTNSETQYDNQYLQNTYLNSLPFPQYFEEFDVTTNGNISAQDVNFWETNYARPDIANEVQTILNDIQEWNELTDMELIGQVDVIRFNEQDYYSRAEHWTGETGECVPVPVSGYQNWKGLNQDNADSLAVLGLEQGELTPEKACEIYFPNCLDGVCDGVPNTDCSWITGEGTPNTFYHDAFDCVINKPPIEDILPPSQPTQGTGPELITNGNFAADANIGTYWILNRYPEVDLNGDGFTYHPTDDYAIWNGDATFVEVSHYQDENYPNGVYDNSQTWLQTPSSVQVVQGRNYTIKSRVLYTGVAGKALIEFYNGVSPDGNWMKAEHSGNGYEDLEITFTSQKTGTLALRLAVYQATEKAYFYTVSVKENNFDLLPFQYGEERLENTDFTIDNTPPTFEIQWNDGDGNGKYDVITGWVAVNDGAIPENKIFRTSNNGGSLEFHNFTNENFYIASPDGTLEKDKTYKVIVDVSIPDVYTASFSKPVFELGGGYGQVTLNEGMNEFEWPTILDNFEYPAVSGKAVIRRGAGNTPKGFKINNISIQEKIYDSINFNQYSNEEYFDSAYQTYTPYTDSFWDGNVNKFPLESSVGQIFISDIQDNDLKQNCKLELNTGELSSKSIIDTSGNSNKGLVIGDYKVKKVRKGEPMRRDSFIKVPKKTNNTNGAL